MIRLFRAFLVASGLAVLAASCGSPTSPTITTTTTTTTTSTTSYVQVTDTYDGSLAANGRNTIPPTGFAATPGTITVTVTALQPSTLLPALGLGLGTWDGTTCNIVVVPALGTVVQVGTSITGTASIASNFCVQIWDVNGFAPGYVQNYTITVQHYKVSGA